MSTAKLNAEPVAPLMLAPLTTGATAAAMMSFTVACPLNEDFVSFAATVAVYVPCSGLLQLSRPELLNVTPLGAPDNVNVVISGDVTET